MAKTKNQLFDDLAAVAIYHFSDLLYEKRARRAAKRLVSRGVINDLKDAEKAYGLYEEMVVEHAKEHLPERYELRHDYWGAKMMSDNHGWSDPKTGLYQGDTIGRIMFFDNYAALEEYTQRQLETIPALTETED